MPSGKTGKEWRDLIYDTLERTGAADLIILNEEELNQNLPFSSFLRMVMKETVIYQRPA